MKLAHFTVESHSIFVRHDPVIAELTDRIAALYEEIHNCYHDVATQFADQGRSVAELLAFVGEESVRI